MACSRNGFCLVLTCLLLTGTVCGEECGPIQDNGFRIIGGTDAEDGQYPFVVRIAVGLRWHCAGALIGGTHVLTAAHCLKAQTSPSFPSTVVDPADVTVFIGNTSRFTGEAHKVASVLVHDNYDFYHLNNDIGLVTLSKPVIDEPLARSVCLNENTTVEPGKGCRVLGWGVQDASFNADISETLQVAVDPMLNHTECTSIYGSRHSDSFFCGAGGESNFCRGDSGAPYVCEQSGHWYLYGLAAAHISGAACTWPGKYTKVSYYSQWIQDNMNVY